MDYLWVAEDGMKMQGYNGSQLWDTAFAVHAIVATGLASEFSDCLRRAHSYIDATQVGGVVLPAWCRASHWGRIPAASPHPRL